MELKEKSNFSVCFPVAVAGRWSAIDSKKLKGGIIYGENMV